MHPLDKVIGANLRLLRVKQNITQERMGKMLNPPVSAQQVQKFEKALNRISAAQLNDFAKGLGVNIADFTNIGTVIVADKATTKLTERELVILFRLLQPDIKRCVEGILAALAEKMRSPA